MKKLTAYSQCGGCASKFAAGALARVLRDLPPQHDTRVLVDYRTSDDAGVFVLEERRALVQTVDFFAPIVDDPFLFGQIAAANALSDVYAMGGRPLTALAIAGYPKDADAAVLATILAGGVDKLREAGVALLGGHTVQDQEIKFGCAVTGEVDPARMWTNAGARPGDAIYMTKALGTGAVVTALRLDRAPAPLVSTAVASMLKLNKAAAEALLTLPADAVHACTDVTGFGLLGHASEVAAASECTIELESAAVPLFPGVLALITGHVSGGGRTNAEHFGSGVSTTGDLDPELMLVFHDPQTSGGLLVAINPDHEAASAAAFSSAGVTAWRVGTVRTAEGATRVTLR